MNGELIAPDRENAIVEIARQAYLQWMGYINNGQGERDSEAPHLGRTAWKDVPVGGFWQAHASIMQQFKFTPEDVERCIISNPVTFVPLISSKYQYWRLHDSQLEAVANKCGGWHVLLDSGFEPSESIYQEFHDAGFSKEFFDTQRFKFAKAGRKAALLEITTNLLQTCLNYLDGTFVTPSRHRPYFRDIFVDAQLHWFWDQYQPIMTELLISREDVEALIRFCGGARKDPFKYPGNDGAAHSNIRKLARRVKTYPRQQDPGSHPDQGPGQDPRSDGPNSDPRGPHPAPVPLRPKPTRDERSVALQLPTPEEEQT